MRRKRIWAGVFYIVLVINCSCRDNVHNKTTEMMTSVVKDPHTFARPEEAIVKHIDLELQVDFERKQINGYATIVFDKASQVNRLFLDTKNLYIHEIRLEDGKAASYNLHQQDPILGSALEIKLNNQVDKVMIRYTTGEGAEALQWLDPGQTADKTHPFLFTQSQAILARSWIPLQDSPGVRFTYSASVHVPNGMMALMSAQNPQTLSKDGTYRFQMDQPIPSYLMSLAVGKINFAPVGKRTGVYAEPSMIAASREEFSEMEEMLIIAEQLYGTYRWERYDLIVLPPSFPFGGMENPRITFATPTILAGDKSLTSLVAHELAHSWSGNLVTNATWNDFWLNEGFTVYFEHRIMEALKGREYADMLSSLSMQGLLAEVDIFMNSGKAGDTKLKLDLAGRNPDEGVTTIAYDKGYFFLRYLEEYVGREKFDEFLAEYFNEYAFTSNNTEAFLNYLDQNLFKKHNIKPVSDLNEWVYGEGLPASLPEVGSIRFKKVDQALRDWREGNNSINTAGWSSHEWVHFIKNLPPDITVESIKQLDEKFDFTHSGNAEILGIWFVHCVRHGYVPAFPVMEQFLVHTGRRKFLMPIYSELEKTKDGKKMALAIYQKARPNYHYVSTNSLDKLLL